MVDIKKHIDKSPYFSDDAEFKKRVIEDLSIFINSEAVTQLQNLSEITNIASNYLAINQTDYQNKISDLKEILNVFYELRKSYFFINYILNSDCDTIQDICTIKDNLKNDIKNEEILKDKTAYDIFKDYEQYYGVLMFLLVNYTNELLKNNNCDKINEIKENVSMVNEYKSVIKSIKKTDEIFLNDMLKKYEALLQKCSS